MSLKKTTSNLQISPVELKVLTNSDLMLTKGIALKKVDQLLGETRQELKKVVRQSDFQWPGAIAGSTGKISRGENYKLLPFRVLDYPAHFSKTDIFALRTMFWWGNFFSVTLHLQGEPLAQYRDQLLNNFKLLLDQNIYIAVGTSPWQYHYDTNNYLLLQTEHISIIEHGNFVKLSKKIPIQEYNKLPSFAAGYLEQLWQVLN